MHSFSTIPDFSAARVLVVGDVMLDSYWHGSASRISPEAPVPVVRIEDEEFRIGGAGNVALNVATLGAKAHLLGLAGRDATADQIELLLARGNVACTLQRVAGSKTITKLRIMARHQQLIRLDFEDHFPNWDGRALLDSFAGLLASVDAVVLSDYSKGTLRRSPDLIQSARRAGKPIVVDPKGTDFERYRGATVITPNLSEFEAVVGRCSTDDEIVRRGCDLRDSLELEAVLVTRSEKGMTLLAKDQAPFHLPTRAQEVFDVTGAGDTVVATLASALAAGVPMPEAVTLSNVAAGIVVAKMGTATVAPAELRNAVQARRPVPAGDLREEDALAEQVRIAKAAGERIVMTSGRFDVLNPDLVDRLEKARELGDRLVVAVSNDASEDVSDRKARWADSVLNRARMLSALSCVDWVVPFSEDSPERLYRRLLPDVVVQHCE